MMNMKPQKRHLLNLKLSSADFPGILMDGDDKERDLGFDDREKTDEEMIQQVSQTTGVPAHGVQDLQECGTS